MRNLVAYLSFLIILFGCTGKSTVDNKLQAKKVQLNDTLLNFSELLDGNDSLILYANLSMCEYVRQEEIVFTKENDTTFLQAEIYEYYSGDTLHDKVPYIFFENDSLNFEHLLSKQKRKNIQKCEINSIVYKLVHSHGDTLVLYTKNLRDINWVFEYHMKIMRQFYPNEKMYYLPEPPPLPLEFANEDSIII